MASTYRQLGLLAEERGDPRQALAWTIRCITLFDTFPHPATEPAPHHLQRLTHQLGTPTLHALWHTTTGHPLPPHIETHATHDENENP
ncbi:hypothetical protein GCM10009550_60490 [Actinocorallia libanotica]|uniref:Tetratricopeptide repeat protein n=2 Tax=Actinocorallia libanotica TaxID=46162 RepID=A0ABN1RU99_9ACTN